VDLFATAANTLVERFFAWRAEPLAEGADALSALDWSSSVCPACGLRHREFPFVFPPRAIWPRVVAKLRADRVRAILFVPFALSDPWWHTLAAASLTSVPDQIDPCIIVPSSPRYVSDTLSLGGAQRLANVAIMVVDFRPRHLRGAALAPPCAASFSRRPRLSIQSDHDAHDRRRIAAKMEAAGLSVRAAHPSPRV
jgi:hypothetical protein